MTTVSVAMVSTSEGAEVLGVFEDSKDAFEHIRVLSKTSHNIFYVVPAEFHKHRMTSEEYLAASNEFDYEENILDHG